MNIKDLIFGFITVSSIVAVAAIIYVLIDWLVEKLREPSDQAPQKGKKKCGKAPWLLAAVLGTSAMAIVMGAYKKSASDGEKPKKRERANERRFKGDR